MVLRLSWSESLCYTFLLVLATAHWHGAEAQQVWTARTASENTDWMKVSYGNGMFVGVAERGTQRVTTSPDGITWTGRTVPLHSWNDVVYGNGQWLAVATAPSGTVTGATKVLTSPDAVTWTLRDGPTWDLCGWFLGVTYHNGLFVATRDTSSQNVPQCTCKLMTSPDAITWTCRSVNMFFNWALLAHGNNRFVAIGEQTGTMTRVATSPDGTTWTVRDATAEPGTDPINNPKVWCGLTYGNNMFVAVATKGAHRVMTSPDGITWTARSAAEQAEWWDVTYGGGWFVAIADLGIHRVMTSPDGITWTGRNASAANSWSTVAYGNNMFVALAYDSNVVNESPQRAMSSVRIAPPSGDDDDDKIVMIIAIAAGGAVVLLALVAFFAMGGMGGGGIQSDKVNSVDKSEVGVVP